MEGLRQPLKDVLKCKLPELRVQKLMFYSEPVAHKSRLGGLGRRVRNDHQK